MLSWTFVQFTFIARMTKNIPLFCIFNYSFFIGLCSSLSSSSPSYLQRDLSSISLGKSIRRFSVSSSDSEQDRCSPSHWSISFLRHLRRLLMLSMHLSEDFSWSIWSRRFSRHMHTIMYMEIMLMRIHTNTMIMLPSYHGLLYLSIRSSMDSGYEQDSDSHQKSDISSSSVLRSIRFPYHSHSQRYFGRVNSRNGYNSYSSSSSLSQHRSDSCSLTLSSRASHHSSQDSQPHSQVDHSSTSRLQTSSRWSTLKHRKSILP